MFSSFLTLTIGIYVWLFTDKHVSIFENDCLHPEPDNGKNSFFLHQRGYLNTRSTYHIGWHILYFLD